MFKVGIIGICMLFFSVVISVPALIRSKNNPLPKFNSIEGKEFSEIKMIKTRLIE